MASSTTSSSDLRKRRNTFGQKRTISQYAVSLPNQPDDVSGIHPHDDKFHFFKKGRDFQSYKSKHHYTEEEQKVLATYESADNLPSHTEVYRQWLEQLPPRRGIEDWGIVAIVGISIGAITFVMKECTENLQIFKNPFILELIRKGAGWPFWLTYAGLSCGLASLSAIVCVYLCPHAAGSGVPELIGILNGAVVRNMLSMKTLCFKVISCILTVLSGLPLGFEGPMVHIGAMIGATLARPADCGCCSSNRVSPSGSKSHPQKTHGGGCCSKICRYRDCKERHNLICMGAAAGIASAFSAPITGFLFAMEEMASFWTGILTWKAFVCCILARSVAELLRCLLSAVSHLDEARSFMSVVEFSESAIFGSKIDAKLNLIIIFPTIVLGILGGLVGALFIVMHLKIARFRRKMFSKVKNVQVSNVIKVAEAFFVALICAGIVMGSLPLFGCRSVDYSEHVQNTHDDRYVHFHQYQCSEKLDITFSNNGKIVRQKGGFEEFASLMFGTWEQMIRNLFSRKTTSVFTASSLTIILGFFFLFASWGSQCFLASGLLIPQIAIGALYGRLFGRLLCDAFGKVELTSEDLENWEWMDPGVFALLGAASFTAGTTRLPVTSAVMLMEMTNDVNVSLLIMIVVILAKFIGGIFTHPLYHSLLEFKCIPYLDDDLILYKNGKLLNLELFKAADVMTAPVHCVNVSESLQFLANLLLDTNHGAFPVVETGYGFRRTFLGMITRMELTILLTKTVNFDVTEINNEDIDRIRISYPEYSSSKLEDTAVTNQILNNYAEQPEFEGIRVNLLPYIDTSSQTLPFQFSLYRTYQVFRVLGLRHLVITDAHNQVMGIITRKDLMGFMVEEKVNRVLDKRVGLGGRPRTLLDFSPSSMLKTNHSERDILQRNQRHQSLYEYDERRLNSTSDAEATFVASSSGAGSRRDDLPVSTPGANSLVASGGSAFVTSPDPSPHVGIVGQKNQDGIGQYKRKPGDANV